MINTSSSIHGCVFFSETPNCLIASKRKVFPYRYRFSFFQGKSKRQHLPSIVNIRIRNPFFQNLLILNKGFHLPVIFSEAERDVPCFHNPCIIPIPECHRDIAIFRKTENLFCVSNRIERLPLRIRKKQMKFHDFFGQETKLQTGIISICSQKEKADFSFFFLRIIRMNRF